MMFFNNCLSAVQNTIRYSD